MNIDNFISGFNDLELGTLGRLTLALLILVAGIVASQIAKRSLRLILDRSRIKNDALLRNFFLRITTAVIISLSLLTALAQAGIRVGTFIAGLGVTGLLVGFALRETLSNVAAGVLLLIYRPFRAGDTIEVEGSQGIVEEVTIVNMQMTTSDGVHVILPNSKVWGSKITNFSMSRKRRLELNLKVEKGNVESAIRVIMEAADRDESILKTPAPSARVTALADNAAVLTVWLWTDPADFADAGAKGYLRMLAALKEAEIEAF